LTLGGTLKREQEAKRIREQEKLKRSLATRAKMKVKTMTDALATL
jgi:hypothetical protein